jgi:hypothetical protein
VDSLNPYQPPASLDPPQAESDPDESESEDADLAPNSREEDAARAFKAAILGAFFCPLQIYTAWLLFLVLVNNERLRARYFWYAVGAVLVLIPYAALTGIFGVIFLRY